jgi:hypothetical protein
MKTILTHHDLVAEEVNDEHGHAILLTQQDGLEEPRSVLVHPWQLRAVCEHFGIVASDEQAAKTIQTLQRRMKGLLGRIEHIAAWMTNHSDQRHADLTYEITLLQALQDLANEWCGDFADTLRTESGPIAGLYGLETSDPEQPGLPGL